MAFLRHENVILIRGDFKQCRTNLSQKKKKKKKKGNLEPKTI